MTCGYVIKEMDSTFEFEKSVETVVAALRHMRGFIMLGEEQLFSKLGGLLSTTTNVRVLQYGEYNMAGF